MTERERERERERKRRDRRARRARRRRRRRRTARRARKGLPLAPLPPPHHTDLLHTPTPHPSSTHLLHQRPHGLPRARNQSSKETLSCVCSPLSSPPLANDAALLAANGPLSRVGKAPKERVPHARSRVCGGGGGREQKGGIKKRVKQTRKLPPVAPPPARLLLPAGSGAHGGRMDPDPAIVKKPTKEPKCASRGSSLSSVLSSPPSFAC
jgi:hypothetical protein